MALTIIRRNGSFWKLLYGCPSVVAKDRPPGPLVDHPTITSWPLGSLIVDFIQTRASRSRRDHSTRKTCCAVPKLMPPELMVREVVPFRLRLPTIIGPL